MVAVYNRALTDLEIKMVEAYLRDKWIIPYGGEVPQIYSIADINQDGQVDFIDFGIEKDINQRDGDNRWFLNFNVNGVILDAIGES